MGEDVIIYLMGREKMKRITAVFMFLVLMLCVFPVSSFAASPEIIVGSAEGYAGETVAVDIKMQGNPGIVAMYLDIRYDGRLNLESVKDMKILNGKLFSEQISSVPMVLSWDDSLAKTDNTGNGTLAQLIFRIPQGTPAGTYDINISYDKEEIYNRNLENVDFAVVNGKIKVKSNKVFEDSEKVFRSGEYLYFAEGTKVSDILDYSHTGTLVKNGEKSMKESQLLCSGNTVYFTDKSVYSCILKGDVDSDGDISSSDARLTLRNSVGLEIFNAWQLKAGDVDTAPGISSSDSRLILRASVNLENADSWLPLIEKAAIDSSGDFAVINKDIVTDEEDYYAAGDYIISQLKEFETTVDISAYNVSKDDAVMLLKEFINVVPELFYVETMVDVYSRDNVIEYLEFRLKKNARKNVKDYNERLAEIASLAEEDWSDVRKVLFFHDYLCSQYSYDESLSLFDAYSMMTKKTGVCQAYALLFKALLEYHGIPSIYVSSEKMNHGWNIVKIGSSWYHVDVTFDDPQHDRYGMALHENLLLSDKAIAENGHKDWFCLGEKKRCTSSFYDNYFWKDITSPFAVIDGRWFYIDEYESDYAIYEWIENEHRVPVKTLFAVSSWKGFLGIPISGFHSGFAVLDNALIYNTPDTVLSYDPFSGKQKILYKEDVSGQIFGITVSDGVYVNISSSPDSTKRNIFAINFMNTGDCDGSGYINAKDYTLLLRYVNGYNVTVAESAADINKDGKKNKEDASLLRFLIVN